MDIPPIDSRGNQKNMSAHHDGVEQEMIAQVFLDLQPVCQTAAVNGLSLQGRSRGKCKSILCFDWNLTHKPLLCTSRTATSWTYRLSMVVEVVMTQSQGNQKSMPAHHDGGDQETTVEVFRSPPQLPTPGNVEWWESNEPISSRPQESSALQSEPHSQATVVHLQDRHVVHIPSIDSC